MKPGQLFEQFEKLAEKFELRIIQGKGDFYGGSCIIKQDKVIVVNKMMPIEQRLRVLAQEFSSLNLNSIYIVPALRDFIDENG
jgi:hypothetical protein